MAEAVAMERDRAHHLWMPTKMANVTILGLKVPGQQETEAVEPAMGPVKAGVKVRAKARAKARVKAKAEILWMPTKMGLATLSKPNQTSSFTLFLLGVSTARHLPVIF